MSKSQRTRGTRAARPRNLFRPLPITSETRTGREILALERDRRRDYSESEAQEWLARIVCLLFQHDSRGFMPPKAPAKPMRVISHAGHLATLKKRARKGEALWHPDDACVTKLLLQRLESLKRLALGDPFVPDNHIPPQPLQEAHDGRIEFAGTL